MAPGARVVAWLFVGRKRGTMCSSALARPTKGAAKAAEFSKEFGVSIQGADNIAACEHAELIVVTVPYGAHRPTFDSIKDVVGDKVIVDITVPLQPPKVRSVNLPEGQAAALEARALLNEGARLVAALHHISSEHLSNPEHTFDCDVLVCGDDKDARASVISLVADLGLRGIDAGVLEKRHRSRVDHAGSLAHQSPLQERWLWHSHHGHSGDGMSRDEPSSGDLRVGPELLVRTIAGVPTIEVGDDLFAVIVSSLDRAEIELADGDVIVIASKIVSRAEGCFVDLGSNRSERRSP